MAARPKSLALGRVVPHISLACAWCYDVVALDDT
jgi:hypothetical protein